MAGCRTVSVPTDAAYQPRLDALRAAITPRTRAIVTVSPNNPSGAVYSESALREISDLCQANGVYHISETKWYDAASVWTDGRVAWIRFSRDDLMGGNANGNPDGPVRKGGE